MGHKTTHSYKKSSFITGPSSHYYGSFEGILPDSFANTAVEIETKIYVCDMHIYIHVCIHIDMCHACV